MCFSIDCFFLITKCLFFQRFFILIRIYIYFRLEFEFVSKGYIYRKGRIKVTVSKVFKQGTGESLEGIANSHLVEMSVLATSGSNQFRFPPFLYPQKKSCILRVLICPLVFFLHKLCVLIQAPNHDIQNFNNIMPYTTVSVRLDT